MRTIWAACLLAAVMLGTPATAQDATVEGVLTRGDMETYREVPVPVPAGVDRITVALSYDKADKTVVDLGLWDPERFRGWSGGSRTRFTVSAVDATPGYLAGPLPAGRWKVVLGVPNIRAGSQSRYRVDVWFDRGSAGAASDQIDGPPLKTARGWYRGDLHMHDANSDGTCDTRASHGVATPPVRVPCPLFRTVAAAAASGLDFVAVTDHNTVAHFSSLRELQPWVAPMLLIPGIEITTFGGHANLFAPRRMVDFRQAARSGIAGLQRDAHEAGALFSINHPGLPSGERCMGCGWTWPKTDWKAVDAIEVINGSGVTGPMTGLALWHERLNAGDRITAIAGSDNHDPDAPSGQSPIGRPATVVNAANLSTEAIMAGIRSGNVFIDVEGSANRLLEVSARAGLTQAVMGGAVASGRAIQLSARVKGASGSLIRVFADGREVASRAVVQDDGTLRFDLPAGSASKWISMSVEEGGKPLLIGNAIYMVANLRRPS